MKTAYDAPRSYRQWVGQRTRRRAQVRGGLHLPFSDPSMLFSRVGTIAQASEWGRLSRPSSTFADNGIDPGP